MAKYKPGKANQKRYFAAFYLEAIENADKDERLLNRKALLAAHRESCLFHLMGAYEALIWEVAQSYGVTFRAGMPLQQLLTGAQEEGKSIPELDRLLQLQSQSGGWLNRMLKAWQRVQDVDPAATTVAKAPVNLNAIEVRVVAEEDDLLQLSDWHDNLRELIEETRQTMGEW
ncbi:MAG: hypothetical protein HPY82_24800 [Gammaproteobacteria bacterium]|nr:hypothetical protein [Gammaproteobacteria bacterium]